MKYDQKFSPQSGGYLIRAGLLSVLALNACTNDPNAVDGNTIISWTVHANADDCEQDYSLPTDGSWYQLQRKDNYATVCQTSGSPASIVSPCSLPPGLYTRLEFHNGTVTKSDELVTCTSSSQDAVTPRVTEITSTSARINWDLDEGAPGQIEWGVTTALGNMRLPAETSSNYASHSQVLGGLPEGSTIYFRVFDPIGSSYVSDVQSFETPGISTGLSILSATVDGDALVVVLDNALNAKIDAHLSINPQPATDGAFGNDLGDTVSIGVVDRFTFGTLREGQYDVYLRVRYSLNDFGDNATTIADGRFVDLTVPVDITATVNNPSTDLAIAVDLNRPLIARGAWRERNWIDIWGLNTAFTPTNMDHLSLISDGGVRKIRQRHEAARNGSDRVLAPMELPNLADRIRVKMTIEVAPNYSWGTTSFSGKLAFGVGGGTNTSGGDVDPAGFTLRPSWDAGGELAMYDYAADRQSGNGSYGTEWGTGFFIRKGVPFVLEYEVQMNSSASARDGWFKTWVNGTQVLHQTGIGWMTVGTPKINRLYWSEFHGGANSAWSPTATTWVQTHNISYETDY